MQTLLTLLSTLVPISNACYLEPDIIDPRNNSEIRKIAHEIAVENNISETAAQSMLSCMKNNQYSKTRVISKKQVKSPYCQFNKNLVSPFRIKKGAEFYIQNKTYLSDVEKKYHVDPFIITAIIGVESNYGKFTGNHPTRDALATVIVNTENSSSMSVSQSANGNTIFNDVNKKQFFIDELKYLAKLDINKTIDINTLEGSWDGGIGLAQFMPSSYYRHAVSPKHEKANLFDPEDAVHSIANYLVERGSWKSGPIAEITSPTSEEIYKLASQDAINMIPASAINQRIYRFLLEDGSNQYWLTYNNFEAIRTYNTRPHYAINVMLLAEKIHDYIKSNHPDDI